MISSAQKKLLSFLVQLERAGKTASAKEMADASGLKAQTISDYVSKGYLQAVLAKQASGRFTVSGAVGLSEAEFHRAISQSNVVKELGHGFKSRLAKALIGKSRDNMILALELYNRPSLVNRIDGFTMLFCAAWEQLLKANVCEKAGEQAIFRAQKSGRPPETRSLRDVIEEHFPGGSLARRNLLRIVDLRDQATHLLVPELLGSASRLFQSGVTNFASEFRAISGQGFLPAPTAGLLTLVSDGAQPNPVLLRNRYGQDVAEQLEAFLAELDREIATVDDPKFAIPIEYKLVFTKSNADADISLSTLSETASKTALIVEKPVDPARRCPHTPTIAAKRVSEALVGRLPAAELGSRLAHKGSARMELTMHDFLCIAEREGWKKSTNEFHYRHEISNRRSYSDRAVEVAASRILESSSYMVETRANWNPSKPIPA